MVDVLGTAYRGVKLTALLVVSDELFDLKWHNGFSSPKLKRASGIAGKLLFAQALRYHGVCREKI